jgi:tetratricopeptide (TPR) repeat protein
VRCPAGPALSLATPSLDSISRMAPTVYQQGVDAYETGSYEAAASLFSHARLALRLPLLTLRSPRGSSQAIHLDPSQVKAFYARSKAYEKLGRLRDALTDAKEVVSRLPNSYKVRLGGEREVVPS